MVITDSEDPDTSLTEEELQVTIPPEGDVPEHDDDPELLR